MTDSQSGAPAAGWYADPTGQAGVRWWDGTQWTAHSAPTPPTGPGAPVGPRPRIADTAPVYTPFIWLIVLLPLLSVAISFLSQPHYRYRIVNGIRTIDPASVFTPLYLVGLGLGLVIYALLVVLAYFDYRALVRAGVQRPFHWAWTFLSSLVYVIGRGVIVHQVAKPRGLVPIWIMIGVSALSLIAGIVIAVASASETISQLPRY